MTLGELPLWAMFLLYLAAGVIPSLLVLGAYFVGGNIAAVITAIVLIAATLAIYERII